MKKLSVFTIIITLFCSVNLFAQDVIIKHDGTEIKAKVLEIDDYQIKYKAFDYLDGPSRVINIYDVMRISFENGTIEFYNIQTQSQVSADVSHSPLSSDLKSEFFSIGFDDFEMLEFFRKNNFTLTYNRFASACKMGRNGKTTVCIGGGLTAIGVALIIYSYGNYNPNMLALRTGLWFGLIGETLLIVGIPIAAVAGAKKRSIKDEFAKKEFGSGYYSYQSELNFGLTSNGVGFTLNF